MIAKKSLDEVLERSKKWEGWRNENKDVAWMHEDCIQFEREIVADNIILVVACKELSAAIAEVNKNMGDLISECDEQKAKMQVELDNLLIVHETKDKENAFHRNVVRQYEQENFPELKKELADCKAELVGRKESNIQYKFQINERQIALEIARVDMANMEKLATDRGVVINKLYSQNRRLLKSIEGMGADA